MTRCISSAIMLALIAAHVAVAEEDLATQLKALQKERGKVLTELVEIRTAQVRAGTIPNEYLVGAETDLVNAQLDVADKPEERIAVLERGVKGNSEFLKIVEARFNAGTVGTAEICQARSYLLDSKIRLLRERGPNNKVATQIKALQKERVKLLTELVEIYTAQFRVGTTSCEFFLCAEADLVNAQMDTTDKHEDRVALLEQAVKREAEFLKVAEAKLKVEVGTQADVYRARSLVLTAKIGLLEEGSPNDKVATQVKALQKEQIEELTQCVKLVQDEYRKGATEFAPLLNAETALFNAQVSATDKREGRIAAMEEGVKRETDFLKIVEARINAGTVTVADVRQARSCLLDSKIRLLRERGAEYVERGNALANKGDYDKAIADYNQALTINPNDADSYYNRGIARYSKGDYDKAIADYTEALAINPKYANAYSGRGNAYQGKGEYDKAIADCNEAIRLDRNNANAYSSRGGAWANKGEYDKAIADCNEAIRLDPKYVYAYSIRGVARYSKGEYDKAIADYTQAIRLDPNNANAYTNLTWLYATCPDPKYRDGKKALANANKAYQLNGGKWWGCFDNLAAAYAECGDFDKAKEREEKAIELAKTDKSATEKDKADAASHLESYKQGKPWREELKRK